MKVEQSKEKNPCVVKITVEADIAEVKSEVKGVLNAFVNQAVIPGFRKGKAPVDLVKKNFAKEISQETNGACFRALYPKAIEEAKIEPIATEGVTEISVDDTTGVKFTVLVEVRPEFKLPKYKGLAIGSKDTTVTDEALEERFQAVRKMFAEYSDGKDGDTLDTGDFAQIDYSGTLDGKPLSEILTGNETKAVCGAKGFWTILEEGRFLPEMIKAMKGMKAGEEKTDVAVKFPKTNAPEELKGKKVIYAIKLLAIRKCTLPDAETLAKKNKFDTEALFRADLKSRMEKEAVDAESERRKNAAIDLLLKKCDFDVPPSIKQRQMEMFLANYAQQLQYAGVSGDYIEQNRDAILKEASDAAERQVRVAYILSEIAKAENITSEEKDVGKAENDRAKKALDFVVEQAK